MATNATFQDTQFQAVSTIYNQQSDDKAASKKKGDSKSDAVGEALKKILRDYEKGKMKLWSKILQAMNQSNKDLTALQSDPTLQNSSTSDGTRDMSGVSKEIQNFFMLIYKFLSEHKEGQSKMEIAQAYNMQGKEHLVSAITKGMETAVSHMKHEIHHAEEKAKHKKALLGGLLGAVMAIVTIVCIVGAIFTGGGTLAGAAAADSALAGADAGAIGAEAASTTAVESATIATDAAGTAVTEAGTEAGETATTTAETSATEAESAADDAESAADDAEEAASKASEAAKANPSDEANDLADAAQERATQARQFANTARTAAKSARTAADVARAAQDAASMGIDVSEEASSQVAEATSQVEEASNSLSETSEASSQTQESMQGLSRGGRFAQLKNVAASQGKMAAAKAAFQQVGGKALTIGLAVDGAGAGGMTTGMNSISSDKSNEINGDTQIEQGNMTVDSSATEALQTDLRANMQSQQNEMSEQEADNSQIQSVLQRQATMYTIGSFNA